MKYDRFFNIHIPKTGGTYFRENLLKSIEPELIAKGVSLNPWSTGGTFDPPKNPTFHWCWFEPFITDKTFIFTSLRDPAKRIISHYAWQAIRMIEGTNEGYSEADINKDNFFKWLEINNNSLQNFQSKNLTYYNPNHSIYTEAHLAGWKEVGVPYIKSFLFDEDFSKFNVNKKDVLKNIDRINIIVKSKDLENINFQYKVINQISDEFNIKFQQQEFDAFGHQNKHSGILFDQFTKKEIDFLYDHSYLDSEIYFSDIYTKI